MPGRPARKARSDGLLDFLVDELIRLSKNLPSLRGSSQHLGAVAPGICYRCHGDKRELQEIADPHQPLVVARLASLGVTIRQGEAYVSGARHVSLTEAFAYVADGDGGLQILDARDPASPMHVARYPENRFDSVVLAEDVAASGSYVFVADSTLGLAVIDVANPLAPARVGGLAPHCTRVALIGHYAVLGVEAGWLLVVDVASPSAPQIMGAFDTGGPIVGYRIAGPLLYLAAQAGGLTILDLGELLH